MPSCASSSPSLREIALEHVWLHSGLGSDEAARPGGLLVIADGDGSTITDQDGNTYLDFASGLWLVNVGYGRREIANAIGRQAGRLHYTMHRFPTEPTIRLAQRLADITPGSLSKVFFTGGGTDANEAAMKMAVQYHRLAGEPGRTKFIGRTRSYHGASFATMAVGGANINTSYFAPLLMPDARQVPGPGSSERTGPGAAELEKAIIDAGPETVAAFIAEPISNSAGVQVPDDDYWPAVREICDRHGVLLIIDEVITGFGRTGTLFGAQHWNVVPDIMTMAKGLTSGYVPMGAAIARREVAERFTPGAAEAFQHVVTYGGQPVAAAAAMANLDIIEREQLVQRSAEVGAYLAASLVELARAHPSIVDVRGRGLMQAVQLAPVAPARRAEARVAIFDELLARGVHIPCTGELAILMPPLVVTREEIDRAVAAFDEVLSAGESGPMWWGSW